MELIAYLRAHGLESLISTYAIAAKRHKRYPNLVLLKYDQLNSPMDVKVVQQCRGIISDEADDWGIVSYPYDKFFNHGEPNAVSIDWGTAQVFDKADGSLIGLYYYDAGWHVQTSGMPDADGPVSDLANLTFADLFWRTWKALGYSLPRDNSRCYFFELLTPYNTIVVRHAEPKILLHGARCLETLQELHPVGIALENGWQMVRQFPLGTLSDVLKAAEVLDPLKQEGFVVCDGRFNRVKVKSPQYVLLHHLKSSMTRRKLLEIVRTNEAAEFLTYFPDWEQEYRAVQAKYEVLIGEVEADYNRLRHIPAQKDFALQAVQTRCSGALFAYRAGKAASIREYFAKVPIKSLANLLGLRGIEDEEAVVAAAA